MPRDGIEGDVFQHGPKLPRARINLRLGLRRKADHLGIAAIFEVEHSVVAPAMLVVADQVALGVGGKRRLAGARESKENCHIAAGADVGRAVHGEHALQRQQEIQDRKDGLLDFSGVVGAANDGQPFPEIDNDERFRTRAVHHGRGLKRGRRDHGEFGHVPPQRILTPNLQEHGARKQTVPRLLRDDADGEGVLRVGPGVAVLHENIAALQVALQARQQGAEILAGDGPVVLAPPDLLLGGLLAYHELVGRGARGVFAGVHHQRSEVRETALGTENALLVKRRRRQVPVGAPQIHQPMVGEAVGTGQLPCLFYCGRLHVEVDVHSQSLTSLRSPR